VAGEGRVRGLVGRIGGPERLRQILEVFYERLSQDLLDGFFFAGRDLAKIADGQHAFLMRAFQETERFRGIHPSKAHLQLPPILRGHFDRRLQLLREVLEQEGVHPLDVKAWLKVEEGMRGVVQS
jgi:truncated hemoglobin YjbI